MEKIELEVRGESFEISLVNNYVHEKYTELVNLTLENTELVNRVMEITAMPVEKMMKVQHEIQQAKPKALAMAEKVKKLKSSIIQELLESNGIKYTEEWWHRHTGPEDMDDFMLACVQKDFELGKNSNVKKKKVSTKKG